MEDDDESSGKLKPIIFVAVVICLSVLIIWYVGGMLSQPIETPKKTVQEIKVIRPPPPPPEVEEEPPPEPEVEEEVDIPEPEPEALPDVPDMEPPPGEQLGLDADGAAGGDAFGLVGRKGGRSLLGSGNGSRFAWYGKIVSSDLHERLNEDSKLRSKSYKVQCNLWLNRAGQITKFKMLNSTGDNELDARIKDVLNSIVSVSENPPLEMNMEKDMPIKLLIQSR